VGGDLAGVPPEAPGGRVTAEGATEGAAEAPSASPAEPAARGRPRVALVVNPVAGIGGAVGLKGSDGPEIVRQALALGAVPHAEERAEAAVRQLLACWPADREGPEILAAPGRMGDAAARAGGASPVVVGSLPDAANTTPDDTRRITLQLAALAPDLVLVAGGDGTLRDVCAAIGTVVPVVGIPAGVKIHSPAFATGPRAAGDLAAAFLLARPSRRRTAPAEVLDLDEDAYRRGEIAPRLFGAVAVPGGDRRLQARKEPSPASEAAAVTAAAEGVLRHLAGGGRWVLAPGSTVRAVGERLGVPTTLVGVDVVDVAPAGAPADLVTRGAVIMGTDVGAGDLERLVAGRPAILVVTPIGGQGFILGRGNQQLSPAAIRAILAGGGRGAIVVVATPAKLAGMRGRPLLVDTGEAGLDAELAGHLTVITGPSDRTVYRVAPA
jgi:predicted polyphosphate/ATP-dependent NAD kinase